MDTLERENELYFHFFLFGFYSYFFSIMGIRLERSGLMTVKGFGFIRP